MSSSRFGSLGDFFPTTEVKCRIRGCENKIHVSSEEVIQNLASGKSARPEKMCDECYARLQTLEDKTMPCSNAGCEGTWVWNRYQQLEAIARAKGGEPKPPRGLCDKCRSEVGQYKPIERPCRLRGCKGTWTWTARDQQEAGGKAPAPRLCNECFSILKTLNDTTIPCRIKGCTNFVPWTKYQQLEHIRAGKSLDNPPHRMCEDCFKKFNELKDIVQPCKISGCKNTWTLTAFEQLEIIRNTPEGQEPQMPVRMCKDCLEFFSQCKDIEVPCRNRSCKNTWTWTPGMQLSAHVHGFKKPQIKLCSECVKTLSQLKDEERPCSVKGCTKTWVYRAEDQLLDKCAMREPKPHRCPDCQEFMKTHMTETLTCSQCGKEFSWPVHEQLAVSLGVSTKPEKCSDCASKDFVIAATEAPLPIVSRPKVHIPTTGEWISDNGVRDWPPRMGQDIAKMESTAVHVVCIGDEMTLSSEKEEQSWPVLLEAKLRSRFGRDDIGVLNVGIKGCTCAQGVKRLKRDVEPFNPQLVVASFAFSDARLSVREELDAEAQAARLAQLSDSMDAFASAVKEMGAKLLWWLPNPILPEKCEEGRFEAEEFKAWCERQTRYYDAVLNTIRRNCEKNGVEVVDTKSLFLSMGIGSLQKWMVDWCSLNESGIANIANWLEAGIAKAKLLDELPPVAEEQPAEAPVAEEQPAEAPVAEEQPVEAPVAEAPAADIKATAEETAAEEVTEVEKTADNAN